MKIAQAELVEAGSTRLRLRQAQAAATRVLNSFEHTKLISKKAVRNCAQDGSTEPSRSKQHVAAPYFPIARNACKHLSTASSSG